MLVVHMAIPPATTIAARLLCALDGDQVLTLHDLRDQLADSFELSADDRSVLINADSRETKFGNRVGHARTLLVRLGLAEQPSRGALRITAAGVAVLDGDRTARFGIKNASSAGLYRALDTNPGGDSATAADLDADVNGAGVDGEIADDERDDVAPSAEPHVDEAAREPLPEPAAPLVP